MRMTSIRPERLTSNLADYTWFLSFFYNGAAKQCTSVTFECQDHVLIQACEDIKGELSPECKDTVQILIRDFQQNPWLNS